MVGGVAGAALGSLGGPPGMVAGGVGGVAVSRVLKTVGGAIIRRRLESRQENRAGAAFYTAYSRISARILSGDALRDDGFFEPDATPMGRSPAEEILEGTLRAAANEHEERKVRFLGAFWGNLPFRADVSRSSANFLLHLAERLTWRQFVLLARSGRSTDRQAADLRAELDRRFDDETATDPGIASELDELATLGLVSRPQRSLLGRSDGDEVGQPISYAERGVAEPKLTALGQQLFELLSLEDVAQEDILNTIADTANYRRTPGSVRPQRPSHRRPR